jgi:hypothetical protein
MCSPTAIVTGRPERWISSASWVPVAEAPTTRTPPWSSWSGLRYAIEVKVAMPAGTASARAGTRGMLQAPAASTTVRHCQSPRSVATRYPVSAARTDVTVVPVSTGAEIARA